MFSISFVIWSGPGALPRARDLRQALYVQFIGALLSWMDYASMCWGVLRQNIQLRMLSTPSLVPVIDWGLFLYVAFMAPSAPCIWVTSDKPHYVIMFLSLTQAQQYTMPHTNPLNRCIYQYYCSCDNSTVPSTV